MLDATVTYRIDVDARGFHGGLGWVNNVGYVEVTAAELVRCAVTLGYPNPAATVAPVGTTQWWANVFRMSLIRGYLDHQHPDRLFRSAVYDDADRSEKGAVSYYLGLVAAKLLAERLLGAVQVWHYDKYRPLLTNPGRLSTRPDLLAESDSADRFLIEAKGRTNGYTAALVASAKRQAQAVTSSRPGSVMAEIASVAWMSDQGWAVRFDDPPSGTVLRDGEEAMEELRRSYYDDLAGHVIATRDRGDRVSVVAESTEDDVRTYEGVYEPGVDVYLALRTDVLEQRRPLSADAVAPDPEPQDPGRTLLDRDGRKWSLGRDGVAVRLGETWRAGG